MQPEDHWCRPQCVNSLQGISTSGRCQASRCEGLTIVYDDCGWTPCAANFVEDLRDGTDVAQVSLDVEMTFGGESVFSAARNSGNEEAMISEARR